MLFTRASEYALISLIYISNQNSPIDVDTLATELNIPRSFLAKILQSLAKSGLLNSYKGINGGFSLAKKPSDITVKEVIVSAEKKHPLVFECSSEFGCPNNKDTSCKIFPIINRLQGKINLFLEEITLEEILK